MLRGDICSQIHQKGKRHFAKKDRKPRTLVRSKTAMKGSVRKPRVREAEAKNRDAGGWRRPRGKYDKPIYTSERASICERYR